MTQYVVVLLILDMESAKSDGKKKVQFWRMLINKWQNTKKNFENIYPQILLN